MTIINLSSALSSKSVHSALHTGHLDGSSKLFNLKIGHAASGPLYPRLSSHEGIMIRTNAIADNLDEVLMLPQGHIFPLRFNGRKNSIRRVRKAKSTENARFQQKPHDQDDYYEEIEDYKL